jgi:hypothetical protein
LPFPVFQQFRHPLVRSARRAGLAHPPGARGYGLLLRSRISGSVRFVVNEILHATREALFDIISDPRRRTEWQSSLTSVHVSTGGPPGLGTAWYELTRGGLRFDLEITEFERPLRWAEEARGRIANARLAVSLDREPSASSTRVVVYVEVYFNGPLKLADPLARVLMPAALRADLRRVEALARA